MKGFENFEVWFVTGAQLLYGGDAVIAVDAHFFTAVVNIVVAVHHTAGNGIQLTGILAELADGVAHGQHCQQHGDENGGKGHADADHPAALVHGVALVADGNGIFHGGVRQLHKRVAQGLVGVARIAEDDGYGLFRLHIAGEGQNAL